jgi:spore maturation protein SpmB
LGLDNAATPMGLKAMEQLQQHNKTKDTASDAEILFMIINASSVTLIPITIFMYRAQMGAARPTDVFVPILLATSVSTIVGFFLVALKQKINLFHPLLLKTFGGFILFIVLVTLGFYQLDYEKRMAVSSALGNIILLSLIGLVLIGCVRKKVHCYEAFVEGAKEGFGVAIRIIPYLLAMLVAVGAFRAAGILDVIINGIKELCGFIGCDGRFADALPTAFMKPLSGSGARAMMIETMQNFGADSFAAFAASVVQGSTETTFYVLTVYFGAINVSKTRYALKYALLSDLAGIIAAILLSYLFYAA